MKSEKLRIALFHPWLKSKGGAERVVLEFLKNTIHEVEVYTWVYLRESTFSEFKQFNVKVIAPKFFENFSNKFILRGLFLFTSLFSKIPLDKYDLFFISTSGVGEFITFRNYKKGKTFAYVHSILRDSYKDNVKWNLKYRYGNWISRIIYLFFVNFYRILEAISWRRIDVAIFNSSLSQNRAWNSKLLEDKKSFVVYPPTSILGKNIGRETQNYFLYVSRFNYNKRQDVLLDAWREFMKEYKNYKLILAGSVEGKGYFEKINQVAKEVGNVEIKTNLSDSELKKLYSGCSAVLFVSYLEDFGIVPFEAMSFGKALIAVDGGGYMDLAKKYKGLIKLKEKFDNKEMSEEILNGLRYFVLNRGEMKCKPTKFSELLPSFFSKSIEDIFKKE